MIFADKIILMRKKAGWSQEELAEKLGVSRQSISKWEGALSVPDLNKILAMAEIFGVSTDFLLKDEIDMPDASTAANNSDEVPPLRRVSLEEANAFLAVKADVAKTTAFAVFLCILSPICLLLLGTASELPRLQRYENACAAVGLIVLLLLIAIAVALFIQCGSKIEPYTYLEKEVIETEYGVAGMVAERKNKYKPTYNKYNLIGTMLCLLSVIPLFCSIAFEGKQYEDLFAVGGVCALLLIAGIGVIFFVIGGINWTSMEQLLQEGDYTVEKKLDINGSAAFSSVYWLTATAIYLSWSFLADNWHISWVVWVVAGVLFPAVLILFRQFSGKGKG